MSDAPRFEIVIRPVGDEAQVSITASAADVTVGEILHYVLKSAALLSKPADLGRRWPTADEVRAEAARQQILREHPATRLFVRDGKQLWLSEEALETHVLDVGIASGDMTLEFEAANFPTLQERLTSAGWVDAGPAPEGVARACDYAMDGKKVLELC